MATGVETTTSLLWEFSITINLKITWFVSFILSVYFLKFELIGEYFLSAVVQGIKIFSFCALSY